MFNIGGQGQYIVGLVGALWVGPHLPDMAKPAHLPGLIVAALAGALWAAIAGAMKAAVGAHEVISTIMLNWIAIYGSSTCSSWAARCRARPGPCRSRPRCSELGPPARRSGARLQPLHAGFFLALAALVVYWL